MDKLEKALEKAKAERQVRTPAASYAAQPATGAVREAGALPSGQVELGEDVLEQNRILALRTRCKHADRFRLLRTQVLQTMARHGFKTVAVTSPNYGEGKTTVSLNLALSIAQDVKQTVLLVDLDLRKPSVHNYLGLQPEHGLTDYLSGRAELGECLLRLSRERMSILPAGRVMHHSSEVIGSPEMSRLASEVRDRYADRLVIYDMPPLLAQDDPLAFIPHVDAVLLVVQDGVTKAADVRRSLEILENAKIIGTVLNDRYEDVCPRYDLTAVRQVGLRGLFPRLAAWIERKRA